MCVDTGATPVEEEAEPLDPTTEVVVLVVVLLKRGNAHPTPVGTPVVLPTS